MNKANIWGIVAIRFPWLVIGIFVAITVFFGLQLSKATIDTDMKNQLPDDLATRLNLDEIEKMFGGTDMAMIVVSGDDMLEGKTLERVQAMSDAMSEVEDFDRVISLFTAKNIRGGEDDMVVEQAVDAIPENAEEKEQLRLNLKGNELVYGNLVSEDFKHTVLIGFLTLKAKDEEVVDSLKKIISDHPGPEEAFVGGMPLTRVHLTKDMRKDMRKFLPVGLVLMLIFLFACFREVRGMTLPFLVTLMGIIVAMGLVPVLGWKIHTVTVLLPVILIAVANDYGIHILARYQEDNVPGNPKSAKELAVEGIAELARPILVTGVTTVAGVLCLLSHIIIPAAQLGVLAACGIAFAIFASLLVIPAILSVLPKAKPRAIVVEQAGHKVSALDRMLSKLGQSISQRSKAILAGSVVVSLIVGIGASLVVVDTNPMSFYTKDQTIWKSTNLLNQHLGGWAGVSTIVEGDIKDPKVLKSIDRYEQHLKEHELVGTTTSIASVVRTMNRVMHGDDPKFDTIPDDRNTIAQYFLLYSMSGEPEDFDKLVDFEYKHSQVMAKVTDSGTKGATEVVNYAKQYVEDHPDEPFTIVGGFLDVMADMVNHIVHGQVLSILLSIVIVGAMVGILMRSFAAMMLAIFPLVLALLLLFGIMGFAGIELNLITALLSSIMIGVGVDYTIHFLWRYRDERKLKFDPPVAVHRTLITTGRGIVFNALSVLVGFAVLGLSEFSPVRFFGLLVAISISTCLIGALVVLPATVIIFRPKFLEP